MSDDRKKPLWPWIVALLIGPPVLYVALSGPLSWMRRSWLFGNSVAKWCDRPFETAAEHGPESISEPLFRYRCLFLTDFERKEDKLNRLLARQKAADIEELRRGSRDRVLRDEWLKTPSGGNKVKIGTIWKQEKRPER